MELVPLVFLHCIDIRAFLELPIADCSCQDSLSRVLSRHANLGKLPPRGGQRGGQARTAAVCLGLAAFLAAGCAGTSAPPPRLGANLDRSPLPISDDGLPGNDPVQLTSYSTSGPRLAAKPARDDPSYRLPSLKLASDGPVQRLIEPSNDGPWSPDQAVLPWAEFHDNQVTVTTSAIPTTARLTTTRCGFTPRPSTSGIDFAGLYRRAVQRQSGDRPRDDQLRLRGQRLPGQLR